MMIAQHAHRSDVFHTEALFDKLYNHLQLSTFPSFGRLFWDGNGRPRRILVKGKSRLSCRGEILPALSHVETVN